MKKPLTLGIIYGAAAAVVLGVAIAATNITSYYDAVLRDFLGVIGKSNVIEANDGLTEKQYNKFRFNSVKDIDDYERELVRTIGDEGYVLLKNDTTGNKGLPLTSKTKVSLVSHSSVDILAGGTGSGTGSLDVNLKQAFEDAGYEINNTLWDFYSKGNGSSYKRGPGSVNYGQAVEDWRINECPLSVMEKEPGLLDSMKGTTPIFVISRTGGEGRDLARGMHRHTNIAADKDKHYLEPDSVELGIINYLNSNFDNVILLVNTNNVMELGWVKDYPSIKSVLWAPGGGGQTAVSMVDVLTGKVNPSGHLVDTMAYDNFSSPAMVNFGDVMYMYNGQPATKDGQPVRDLHYIDHTANGFYGVSYDEGIYVGYKYYETRYFDKVFAQGNAGDFNYDETVLYPFGYGLSYTSFRWSGFTLNEVNGDLTVTVDVKNEGNVAGKDVVEVYLNAPYTAYDKQYRIEKSATALVGFAKTGIIQPNQTERVTVKVDTELFRTYDDVHERTYILEDGNYYLTAAKNAHEATNNFLAQFDKLSGDKSFVGKVSFDEPGKDYKVFDKSKSGATVTNRFDDANFIARNKYLSRQDWVGTFPVMRGTQKNKFESVYSERGGYTIQEEITKAIFDKLKQVGTAEAANNPIPDSEVASKAIDFGQKGTMELIDVRGLAYEDVDWNELTKQMTYDEVGYIINLSGYTSGPSAAIQKPGTSDLDGPMGLNLMATHEPFSIAYPAEVTIAATWNEDLSRAHGDAIAQDGLRDNVLAAGWYGPGMNIHRTPFSGRNFEYYSEDAYMSGVMALAATKAAAENGMYAFVKHFALNDQEDHRDQNGFCCWSNEQAMREIYLLPFRMTFEGGTVTTRYYEGRTLKEAQTPVTMAVMTSFNRIGATWAGGDYRLITEVLRNEWNFNGFVLTDYSQGETSYMDPVQMLRAGGDAALSQYGTNFNRWTDANKYYANEAMKHTLYTVVNSNAMNGFTHGAKVGAGGFPNYYFLLIGLYSLAGVLVVVGAVRIIVTVNKRKKLKEAE